MENKSLISLLGCGWVGLPLAKSLISNGFKIRASTTTESKIKTLKQSGIDPYLVQFSDCVQLPDLKNLFEAETLIISIPPGRRDPKGFNNYMKMISTVCDTIPNSDVSRIIFISSTSVYPESNSTVDEFSAVAPDTESGKLLAEAEQTLQQLPVTVITLRLAGLIGPGRMPGKFFAGKTDVANGLAPVNLIHLTDVILIIRQLLADPNSSGVYNGCSPSHPTKEEFYTLAAQREGLEQPQFRSEKLNWKIVTSKRLEKELNFEFKIPSLMDWIDTDIRL